METAGYVIVRDIWGIEGPSTQITGVLGAKHVSERPSVPKTPVLGYPEPQGKLGSLVETWGFGLR